MADTFIVNPYEQRLDSEVSMANGLDLTLMLYDKALQLLEASLATGQVREADLTKASRILDHFRLTLDWSASGPLAVELDRLYEFSLFSLSEAMRSKSLEPVRAAQGVLKTLQEGWLGARNQLVQSHRPEPSMAGASSGVWG